MEKIIFISEFGGKQFHIISSFFWIINDMSSKAMFCSLDTNLTSPFFPSFYFLLILTPLSLVSFVL